MSERPPTILVVEDNPITRKLFRVALEIEGYRVLEAPNGHTALELAETHTPALAILDLLLPDIDGIELCRRLRATPVGREMPILACSGLQSKLEDARSLQAGFTDLLFKPIEPARLIEAVRPHLHRQAAKGKAGRKRRILLVDDDPVQRKLNKLQLEQVGFHVALAADGLDALAQAGKAPPDAIVSDVLMPRMNGLQLSVAIRQDPRLAHVPIVLTSATLQHIEDADRRMAQDLGANSFVPRTPGFEEVVAELLAALETPPPSLKAGAQSLAPDHLDRFLRQVEMQASLNATLAKRAALDTALLSIAAIGAAVWTRKLDLQQMLDEVLARALDAGGVSAGAIYLVEGGDQLRLRSQVGSAATVASLADFFGHCDLLWEIMRGGRATCIPGAGVPDTVTADVLMKAGARSVMTAPLIAGGEPFGVLVMMTDRQELEDRWLGSMSAVATHLAQAVALSRSVSELALSEERYRVLFETNPLPCWVFDRETLCILAVNDEAVDRYGYSREEFLRLTVRDLRPPEDVPALLDYLRSAPQAFHQAGVWRHRTKDGTLITVEISGHPLTWQGRSAELVVVNDITERLQTEQTLRDRELRFRQLTENMHEVFFVEDAQLREMLYISPAYADIWGRSCQSLYDSPGSIVDPIPMEDRGRLFASITQAQEGKTPDDVEFRVVRPDGTTRWVLARSMPVRNEQGEVYRIAGVVSDITERKRADDLFAQRTRLAELNADVGAALSQGGTLRDILQRCAGALVQHLDAAFARIWTLNDQTQVLELQASAGQYTHLDGPHSRVPVGQLKIGLIAHERQPHLTNAVIGDPRVNDQEWARREGMVAFAGYPLVVADRVVGVMAMFARHPFSDFVQEALASIADSIAVGVERKRGEDALRANEERFRALVENSGDAIALLDRDGAITYASQSTPRVLGYEPSALVGTSALALLHPDDIAVIQEQIGTLRDRPGVVIGLAGRFRHQDGSWRHGEGSMANRLQDPAVRALVFNFRDVTPQRQLEGQYRQAQKMEAVGRLAGGVAHDFNNLLTVIFGYAELMSDDLPEEGRARQDLAEIRKAATQASSLTKQLLAFSRQQVLQTLVLTVNDLVEDLRKMLRRLIGEDVELRLDLHPDAGNVRADPGQLQQVLMNLVVNARDAMPTGGTLRIETAPIDLPGPHAPPGEAVVPGRYVLLSVRDTGTGMDAETLARVFEPFFTTKEKGQGTGLGLSTVYGTVQQSGGYVRVESEPGRGTTFEICLPTVDAPAEGLAVAAEPAATLTGTETVLVAEDDAMLRPLVTGLLQRHGYRVLVAQNADEALAIAREHVSAVHLLVTDVVMPGASGRELARRLADLRPETRVLYMSGYTDDAMSRHGVLEPGLSFLQKPFTPAALARKVREVLDAPPP